jgi:multidrug efflux pump
VTVPVSLIGTFIVLYALGYTINLLTLLALVLAIGLIVDDAIVVIENIHRRIEMGEPRLVAAFRGTRQVGFAVIATTIVLVSVFIPITFLEGDLGRLFTEFAITMTAAVIFSSFVALTLSPVVSSKFLDKKGVHNKFTCWLDATFERLQAWYVSMLSRWLYRPVLVVIILVSMLFGAIALFKVVPSEYTPKEDRGVFFVFLRGPEGTSYEYTMKYLNELEKRLMPFVETGEIERLLMRAPRSFGSGSSFNDAIGIIVLSHWDTGRKPIWYYVNKTRELTADMTGVRVSPIVRQALGGGTQKPIQFVLGGSTYKELAEWRDIILAKAEENPKILGLDHDYLETKPQVGLTIRRDRAADLGVSVSVINRTLESMLGSRQVTTFIDRGEEYDVILESEKDLKQSPSDISNIYVRSETTGKLIPLSNLIDIREFADAASLNRYNRIRSITLDGNLADGYSLGEALEYLEGLVRTELPPGASIDYKGASLDYVQSGESLILIFALALTVVFLVLAGQFESFLHPFIIILTVPLAITGALLALWALGLSLNIYSQIGLIILIGLAAKNGILIVEFINQLRDEGIEFSEAILEASSKRLRPILMTAITTVMGSVPLIVSFGAGAETRFVIGVVIFAGVISATIFTLFIVPIMYQLLAKNTQSPHAVSERLETLLKEHKDTI